MDADSETYQKMKHMTTVDFIKDIIKDSGARHLFSPSDDILLQYEEALATSGKSAKSIILKHYPK